MERYRILGPGKMVKISVDFVSPMTRYISDDACSRIKDCPGYDGRDSALSAYVPRHNFS
jgi:hypothetical protein